jgi:glycosyltransferase involved in cell wall biosynthesis
MIVGPYEEPFLEAAVLSTYNLCDEWVFIDTAPDNPLLSGTRGTIDYLKEYELPAGKVKIIDMPRGEDKDFSFAEARELARVNTESDWILRLDADEVIHEDDIQALKDSVEGAYHDESAIQVSFYHFMIFPWLYQYTEIKTILFKKDCYKWVAGVHEELERIGSGRTKYCPVRYYHYGYCRGQEEVFKRWQLYVDIEGKPDWYNNTNPATILDDRISVCKNFKGEHPKVVQGVLEQMFDGINPFQVKEIETYSISDNYIGFLLITYNDAENLKKMLPSLEETVDYPMCIYVADIGSEDDSVETFLSWYESQQNPFIYSAIVQHKPKLEALTKTMNDGFKFLMSRQECNMIGWIHPDMTFEPEWLSWLVSALNFHQDIGKVCSFNLRDGEPQGKKFIDGQEQCYIIKRNLLYRVGLFDENFIGIGGYEDWDLNNRIRREGLRVVISTQSRMWHKGMATRERRDTTAEQIHNSGVYQRKWGTHKEDV